MCSDPILPLRPKLPWGLYYSMLRRQNGERVSILNVMCFKVHARPSPNPHPLEDELGDHHSFKAELIMT